MKPPASLKPSVLWYYLRSFFVRPWTLRDYPVFIGPFRIAEANGEQSPGVRAGIVGWMFFGIGKTEREARDELERRFLAYATSNALPRPGTSVPISFAASDGVDTLADVRDDFIERVLRLSPGQTFVSDLSDLSEFPEPLDAYNRRAMLLYGLDLEALPDTLLVTALRAIAAGKG